MADTMIKNPTLPISLFFLRVIYISYLYLTFDFLYAISIYMEYFPTQQ